MTDCPRPCVCRTASPLRGVGRSGMHSQRPRPGRSGTQWDAVSMRHLRSLAAVLDTRPTDP